MDGSSVFPWLLATFVVFLLWWRRGARRNGAVTDGADAERTTPSDGVTESVDSGTALPDDIDAKFLRLAPGRSIIRLVTTYNQNDLVVMRSILDASGIPTHVEFAAMNSLFPGMAIDGYSDATIVVFKEDAAAAADIIAEYIDDVRDDQASGANGRARNVAEFAVGGYVVPSAATRRLPDLLVPRERSADTARPSYYFTYQDIHRTVSEIAQRVLDSGFDPHVIVAIGSGGYIPARILRTYLNRPILAVGVSYYDDEDRPTDSPRTVQWIEEAERALAGKRVLLVDEVDDSRATLEYCVRELLRHGPQEVAVAVLHDKTKIKRGAMPPEVRRYFAGRTIQDKWVKYPWDARDIDEHDALARGGDPDATAEPS